MHPILELLLRYICWTKLTPLVISDSSGVSFVIFGQSEKALVEILGLAHFCIKPRVSGQLSAISHQLFCFPG